MKSQLFIPKKCKVGFNLRQDTYTGKLGYIIMHDGKVWRKENSWEGWREKEATEEVKAKYLENYELQYHKRNPEHYPAISSFEELPRYCKGKIAEGVAPIEFDNTPTEGFVLNRKAGGENWGWNPRQTYCRVYDPRGFEFEITIQNLLFILQETNSIKGKGLEGQFVYSWDKKDLVLLPVGCQEYKSSSGFTSLQDKKIELKTLIEGAVYKTKKEESVIYLGKFDWWEWKSKTTNTSAKGLFSHSFSETTTIRDNKKKLIFFNLKDNTFVSYDKVDKLAECINDTPVSNYAELVSNYLKSKHGIVIEELIVEPLKEPLKVGTYNMVAIKKGEDLFWGYLHTHYGHSAGFYQASLNRKIVLEKNKIIQKENYNETVNIPKNELETSAVKFSTIVAVNSQGEKYIFNELR